MNVCTSDGEDYLKITPEDKDLLLDSSLEICDSIVFHKHKVGLEI